MIPIHILAEERKILYVKRTMPSEKASRKAESKIRKLITLVEWEASIKGR